MKIEYVISGLALLISIIFGIISWKTSNKANELQKKVITFSTQAKEFEVRKGEILLMSLLSRYFTIQFNCWEPSGKMRTDKISIDQYINELQQLNSDVNVLVATSFYIEVLAKYPEINLLWISLRGFIIEREQIRKMAISQIVFDRFYDLYFKVKKEIDNKDIFNNQFYVSTEDVIKFLDREIKNLKQTSR